MARGEKIRGLFKKKMSEVSASDNTDIAPTREERRQDRKDQRFERRLGRQDSRLLKQKERQDQKALETQAETPKVGETVSSALNAPKADTQNVSAPAVPTAPAVQNIQSQEQVKEQGLVQKVDNSLPSSGQTLVNAVTGSDSGFYEQNQAVQQAKVLNTEEEKAKDQIAGTTVQDVNDINQSTAPIATQGVTENVVIPGDGKTAVTAQGPVIGTLPSYTSMATKKDVANNLINSASNDIDNVPGLVLEKLQPHDYYPNISKDIGVGTYSGKYLGSVTLFAAPGARLPMGLYDARKRALAEQAKAKQAEIDKLLSVPETDALYQAGFSESFLNGALELMQKHKFNTTSLKRDPEALKFFAGYQAKAKEITAATAFANSIMDKSQDLKNYIPKEMRDNAYNVKMNLLNKLDDILKGGESAIKPIQDAKVYSSLVPEVDKLAKDLLNPERMAQSPLRLKNVDQAKADAEKRGEKFNAATYEKERNDFIATVNDGNYNTDTYVTGIRKFFGGDYEAIIDNLIAATPNSNAEQSEALKKYFAAQIQEQDILKYSTAQNANQWQANLAERMRQFDITRKDKENNFFGGINDANTDAINKQTGKSFNQELAELQAKGLKGPALQTELQRLSQVYQVGTSSYYDPSSKSFVNFVQASPELRDNKAQLQRTVEGDKSIRKVNIEFSKDGKTWTQRMVPIEDIQKYYAPGKFSVRDASTKKEFTLNDFTGYKSQKSGTAWTKPSGVEIRKGFVNSAGQVEYLQADGSNLAAYNASKAKATYAIPIEKVFSRKEVLDRKTNTMQTVDTELPGIVYGEAYDISNPSGQAQLNNQWGYNPIKAAESAREGETWDYGTGGGGFSATVNPGEQ